MEQPKFKFGQTIYYQGKDFNGSYEVKSLEVNVIKVVKNHGGKDYFLYGEDYDNLMNSNKFYTTKREAYERRLAYLESLRKETMDMMLEKGLD